MIGFDCLTYRHYENIAKTLLPNWRIGAIFSLDVFQKNGIPIRAESVLTLRSIIDTMQEERFVPLINEFGGLNEDEISKYIERLVSAIKFQTQLFPHLQPLVPFDAMLHAFLVYDRISKIKPNFKTLLEIGPGCGYNSFFLQGHSSLENYSVIEACESFYLLQNHINQFCFSENFCQKAPIKIDYTSPKLNQKFGASDITYAQLEDHSIDVATSSANKVNHFPWWQLGDFYNNDQTFDIVMSNSNLNEFTNGCLLYYLDFINKKLSDDGYFVYIGPGYYDSQSKMDNLLDLIYAADFAPLFISYSVLDDYDIEKIKALFQNEDEIVLAPFSEKIQRLVNSNLQYFQTKNIVIIDDNADKLEGCNNIKFIKPCDAKSIKSNTVLIGTFEQSTYEKIAKSLCDNFQDIKNIEDYVLYQNRLCMPNAVFVNKNNPLYAKYHKKEYFKLKYFCAKEFDSNVVFNNRKENSSYITKEQAKTLLVKQLNKK